MTNLKKKLTLAYLSPMPPMRSGIAYYSAMLLPALCQHYEVDVVVDAPVSETRVSEHWALRDVEWFINHACNYDRVIYHIGNSPFHYYMLNLIERFPGVVVLHDFFLGHAVSGMDELGIHHGYWSQSLYENHGEIALYEWFKQLELENLKWTYPVNAQLLNSAHGVIVHAEYSKRLAEAWYGQDYAAHWAVIPLVRNLPEHHDRPALRSRYGLEENDFLICSFGMLGAAKLNDRLLSAWLDAGLSANKSVWLIFVGEPDYGVFGQTLTDQIAQIDCADRIKITGWVGEATYHEYLAIADMAVQLRASSRGEMSAAVLDCMRYGLPTIVNAQGGLSEIVAGAVYQITADCPQAELVGALKLLLSSENLRQKLATEARLEIERHHLPEACAQKYVEVIESFYAGLFDPRRPNNLTVKTTASHLSQWALIKQLRQVHHDSEANLYLRMCEHRKLIQDQLADVGKQLTLIKNERTVAEVKLRFIEKERMALEVKLRATENRLGEVLASRSWASTQPIRCLVSGLRNILHYVLVGLIKIKARFKHLVKVILIQSWVLLGSKSLFLKMCNAFIHRFPVAMYRIKYFLKGTPLRPAQILISEALSRNEQVVYERLKFVMQDKRSEED